MSEYRPEAIPLGMGIDLASPKLAAPKGSLLSCLNYEVTDTLGLTRIAGYEAYDGKISGANEATYVFEFTADTALSVGDILGLRSLTFRVNSREDNLIVVDSVGDNIYWSTAQDSLWEWDEPIIVNFPPGTVDTANIIIIGKVVKLLSSRKMLVSVTNYDLLYDGAILADLDNITTEYTLLSFQDYSSWAQDNGVSVQDMYAEIRSTASYLRGTIGSLPGVVGLHWYEDSLYAVAPSSADPTKGALWVAVSEQKAADAGAGVILPGDLGWQEISGSDSLPLFAELSEARSRYMFINSNFKGSDDSIRMFGVNGVGRAFTYDGTTFEYITAIPGADLDKPRHIAVHKFRLCLGYPQGSVLLSKIGDPLVWDATLGAAEIAVGDRVTGLQSLVGDYLGIFCLTSVKGLLGDPTGSDAELRTLSANTGCLEYSLTNVGNPVYCNSFGIVSLESTDAYGDFAGVPLSFKISPLIKPRMKSTTGRFNIANALLGVMPVRSKNQYRFIFKDGLIITMTRAGNDEPQFTTRQYDIFPYCWSSEYDQNGEEQVHMSDINPNTNSSTGFVYALEKGWGFNGRPFLSDFALNPIIGESPVMFTGVMKCRLHGLTRGLASLKLQVAGNQEDYDFRYSQAIQELALPRSQVYYSFESFPATDIIDLASRGLMINLKISSNDVTLTEPVHTCQALLLMSRPQTKIDV